MLRLTALKSTGVDLAERKGGSWTRDDAFRYLVQRDDFLIARGSGSLRRVGMGSLVTTTPDEVAFPDTAVRARLHRDVIAPRYMSLAWNSPAVRSQLESMARTTAGIYKVNQRQLASVRLPVPSLAEQRRIVDILEDHLSRLDAADADVHRADVAAPLVQLAALTRARSSLSKRHAVSAIGGVAETTLGKMLDAKRQVGTPTPYLRNVNVRWGRFDLSDVGSTPLTQLEIERLSVQSGDVLVCEGGEPGRCAVWTAGRGNLAFQKALHRLRVRDQARLDPHYLALMLTEAVRTGRLDRLFTGTTIKHLPQEKLRQIEIPLPPMDTQQRLVATATAEASDRLMVQLHVARRRSEHLRRALLAAAFSGRLTGRTSDFDQVEEMAVV